MYYELNCASGDTRVQDTENLYFYHTAMLILHVITKFKMYVSVLLDYMNQ